MLVFSFQIYEEVDFIWCFMLMSYLLLSFGYAGVLKTFFKFSEVYITGMGVEWV